MASEFLEWFFAYLKWNWRWAFLSGDFLLATWPYRPDLCRAWDVVVTCTQWPVFAIKACSNCSSFKVASGLSDQSPPCLVIQFGVWPDLGRVLVVPYTFHFLMIVLTVLQGIFKAFEIFLYHPLMCAFPQLYPRGVLKAPWCSWLSLCCEMHHPAEETYRNSRFYSEIIRITTI